MASYNKVLLMGNLTRDVELKSIPSGQTVARIGLAVNRRWTGQDGQRHEEVTFIDCEAWGRTGENIAKFFSKGRPIFIEGRLKLDQWEDKQGNKQSKLRVVVEGFEFVDSRPGGNGNGGTPEGGWSKPSAAKPATAAAAPSAPTEPIGEGDIPF